jgi:hypothetical protein
MIPEHSSRRALRSAFSGQGRPVMSSLSPCPLPSASQKRPGNIPASVAAARAKMVGW